MKVVILAGGRGTRISEETETIPKPMVSTLPEGQDSTGLPVEECVGGDMV